jgi:protein-S-isoprenylcysteine O-methyltransferase Ste14
MVAWIPRATMLLCSVLLVVIPAVVHRRGVPKTPARSRKGPLERALLTVVSIAFLLTIAWIVFPILSFADSRLRPASFAIGVVCLSCGLWLLYRSHADLGDNWSITLELRKEHELRTDGVYRSVRHPMYAALLIYAAGQALVVPNWLVGPSYLAAVLLLVACRLGTEERMMSQEFGNRYEEYVARTKRLVPGVW